MYVPYHNVQCTWQVEFVVAFLGVTLARAVAAPLNSAYKEDEFRFYMEDAASKLLIVPKRGNKHAEAAASGLKVPIATFAISIMKGTRHDLKHMSSPYLLFHTLMRCANT